MKELRPSCLHHFDLKFGWATCLECEGNRWFDPFGWKKYINHEISFDQMRAINNVSCDNYNHNKNFKDYRISE